MGEGRLWVEVDPGRSNNVSIFLGVRRKHVTLLRPFLILSPRLLFSHLTLTLALNTKRRWHVSHCPLSPWAQLPHPHVLSQLSQHTESSSSHRPPKLE